MSHIACSTSGPAFRLPILLARSTAASIPGLDFLYPAFSRRTFSTVPRSIPNPSSISYRAVSFRFLSRAIKSHAHRGFSTTTPQQKTLCIHNPAVDEDGKGMHMEITTRAAKRLTKIMKRDNKPGLALKVQVESGGCHGFQYTMSLVEIPDQGTKEWDETVGEDDTIFQYIADDAVNPDTLQGSPKIILDEPSLSLLKDSKVDFTSELIGSQFKIVDNPRATSSCGCGTSFDVAM
ncbi:Iron-sulfur assembly protein 2 [Ceratocystis lukuohia]